MTSELFTKMGLGNIDVGLLLLIMFVLILALITLVILFIVKNNKLLEKYKKFMKGSTAESLENEIMQIAQDIVDLKRVSNATRKDIRQLYKNMESAVQKVGLVKYDAYQQMGGLLSFCLVMLDENNNGFVVNSVHSTEGCYTYTKEIKEGISKIELGKEEQLALEQAMGSED